MKLANVDTENTSAEVLTKLQENKKKGPPIKLERGAGNRDVKLNGTESEIDLFSYLTFGTTDPECIDGFMKQLVNAHPGVTEDNVADIALQNVPLLQAIAPRDELEAMLGLQMITVHNLTMQAASRARQETQSADQADHNINRLVKLSEPLPPKLRH